LRRAGIPEEQFNPQAVANICRAYAKVDVGPEVQLKVRRFTKPPRPARGADGRRARCRRGAHAGRLASGALAHGRAGAPRARGELHRAGAPSQMAPVIQWIQFPRPSPGAVLVRCAATCTAGTRRCLWAHLPPCAGGLAAVIGRSSKSSHNLSLSRRPSRAFCSPSARPRIARPRCVPLPRLVPYRTDARAAWSFEPFACRRHTTPPSASHTSSRGWAPPSSARCPRARWGRRAPRRPLPPGLTPVVPHETGPPRD